MGSGTISGTDEGSFGCMLELSKKENSFKLWKKT